MNIHLLTRNRAPGVNHFAATESSLLANVDGGTAATVFVENGDVSHLDQSLLLNHVVPTKPWEAHPHGMPRWYATATAYLSALRRSYGDVLILEDDIMFTRDFSAKLARCLAAIPVPRYVLSLYAPFTLTEKPVEQVNPVRFRSTQALFFPETVRKEFAAVLEHDIKAGCAPIHLCLQHFCETTGTPLYVANPNLVQHTGRDFTRPREEWVNDASPTFVMEATPAPSLP